MIEVYDVEFMRMFARELMDLIGRVREWTVPYVDCITGEKIKPLSKTVANAFSINKSVADLLPRTSFG